MPPGVLSQARSAARAGIGLGTILRCCMAGERLLADSIADLGDAVGESVRGEADRARAAAADHLTDAISAAYLAELEESRRSPSRRLADSVEALLAGDGAPGGAELGYTLERWHVGLIVAGPRARQATLALAAAVDLQALVVPRSGGVVWAWLGGRERPAFAALKTAAEAGAGAGCSFAIGEARQGLGGWRLTHREAEAAALVMDADRRPLVRGKEVLLLATTLRDEALADSLLETFLAPLDGDGDLGLALRETLRAYLACGCNAVAAAATLRVNRHTVQRRLRRIEEALGDTLHVWHSELKLALDLEQAREATAARSSAAPADREDR